MPKITVATYITLSRFILVPIFIYLFLVERYIDSMIILILCGLTDGLDGFVARRFHQRSRLGSLLDPVADKFLMMVSFIVLAIKGFMPWKMTCLVIGRDLFISFGALFLMSLGIKLLYKPTILSKVTTTLQILVLAFSFLDIMLRANPFPQLGGFAPVVHHIWTGFYYVTALFTLITFVQYFYIGLKYLRYGERKQS